MLTKAGMWSMTPSGHYCRRLACFLCGLMAMLFPCIAYCEDAKKTNIVLLLEPPKDSYSYRKTNQAKTLSIMLYGFKESDGLATNPILKDRKALSSFFKQHIDRAKDDYLSKDPNATKFITGGSAFNSTQLNRGQQQEEAKMVGFTMPIIKKLTFGGGYTWGEKNPALMRLTKAEGLFTGFSYDTGNAGFQLSYLLSGQKVAGFKMGGTNIRYDSIMLGTSFKVTKRMGLTATLQYRKDEDPLTTGERQAIFTVGTKWRF